MDSSESRVAVSASLTIHSFAVVAAAADDHCILESAELLESQQEPDSDFGSY